MVANPMQRKSKTSLILGIIIGILIMGVVVAFMFMQLQRTNEKLEEMQANRKLVYVLTQDVESGELVTEDMFNKIEVDAKAIPVGATSNADTISGYFLGDDKGNRIITVTENGQNNKYLERDGQKYLLSQDNATQAYYITVNGQREDVTLSNIPLVAKIKLNKNTVVTNNMFTPSDEKTTNDVRKQEYNMISLSSSVQTGDFIDIRLRMPSGLDYIVLSKKKVEIPDIGGIPSETAISLNLTEDELLIMSQAIVEAYMAEGSMLYTVNYVEPGMQTSALTTYIPSEATINLITHNPNVVDEAATALLQKYQDDRDGIKTREKIAGEVNSDDKDAREDRVKSNTSTEVSNRQTLRKNYLNSLAE